jgi:predicted restriction endonuclease
VCDLRLSTGSGAYAEGAHIQPRGKPHNGPDVVANVLCLCPNDHVLFDRGALTISDAFEVVDTESGAVVGSLRLRAEHRIEGRFLEYHRRHFAGSIGSLLSSRQGRN